MGGGGGKGRRGTVEEGGMTERKREKAVGVAGRWVCNRRTRTQHTAKGVSERASGGGRAGE